MQKHRKHLTAGEKRRIRALTERGWMTRAIARALNRPPITVRRYQLKAELPTRCPKLDPQKVLELAEQGMSAKQIATFLARKLPVIERILAGHATECARAAKRAAERENEARVLAAKAARKQREESFCAAIRRREDSVRQLCFKYGVSQPRGYKLAHEIWPGAFKNGAKADELPLSELRSEPEKPQPVVADAYTAALIEFLNKFADGKLPLPQDDLELVRMFVRHIPESVDDYTRTTVGYNLVRALDQLRRASPSPWVH